MIKYTTYFVLTSLMFSAGAQPPHFLSTDTDATRKKQLTYSTVIGATLVASVGGITAYKIYESFKNTPFKLNFAAAAAAGGIGRWDDKYVHDDYSSDDYDFFAVFDGHGKNPSWVSKHLGSKKQVSMQPYFLTISTRAIQRGSSNIL